jgi:putative two-component system response regulator
MHQNPHTILIIDDEPTVARILRTLLQRAGFTSLTTGDGEKGYELAVAQSPSLIFCDERMPGLSGDETLQKLKANPATAHIPVIMMGGSGFNGLRDWTSAGAVGFVAKPFQMTDVLSLVRRILLEDHSPAR